MAVFCRPGHFGSSREFRQVGSCLLQFNSAKKRFGLLNSRCQVNDILRLRVGKGLLLVSTKIVDFIT